MEEFAADDYLTNEGAYQSSLDSPSVYSIQENNHCKPDFIFDDVIRLKCNFIPKTGDYKCIGPLISHYSYLKKTNPFYVLVFQRIDSVCNCGLSSWEPERLCADGLGFGGALRALYTMVCGKGELYFGIGGTGSSPPCLIGAGSQGFFRVLRRKSHLQWVDAVTEASMELWTATTCDRQINDALLSMTPSGRPRGIAFFIGMGRLLVILPGTCLEGPPVIQYHGIGIQELTRLDITSFADLRLFCHHQGVNWEGKVSVIADDISLIEGLCWVDEGNTIRRGKCDVDVSKSLPFPPMKYLDALMIASSTARNYFNVGPCPCLVDSTPGELWFDRPSVRATMV